MITKKIEEQEIDINEENQIFNEKTRKFKTKKIDIEKNQDDEVLITQKIEEQNNNIQPEAVENVKIKDDEIKISELLDSLDSKTKFFYYFLLIITFGFIKKTIIDRIEDNTENIIKTSTNIPFNITILIHALGGKQNILEISSTISSLKLTLVNALLVDKEKIKEISQRGILVSENKITILFGNYSEQLKHELENELRK